MTGKKRKNFFYEKPGRTPTEHYMYYFGQETEQVAGRAFAKGWKNLKPAEKRFVYYLNESYPDWEQYTTDKFLTEDDPATMTYLQHVVCYILKPLKARRKEDGISVPDVFDQFFRFLLSDMPPPVHHDDLSTLESNLEFADYNLTKLPPENDTIERSIDELMKSASFSYADSFELSCYFFAIAFLVLRERESSDEYENAMLEAFMHLGEFRAWHSVNQSMRKKEKISAERQNAATAKNEKRFGIYKAEVIRILNKDLPKEPGSFKTQALLIDTLDDLLSGFAKEKQVEYNCSPELIKGWARNNKEIKLAFNKLFPNRKDAK